MLRCVIACGKTYSGDGAVHVGNYATIDQFGAFRCPIRLDCRSGRADAQASTTKRHDAQEVVPAHQAGPWHGSRQRLFALVDPAAQQPFALFESGGHLHAAFAPWCLLLLTWRIPHRIAAVMARCSDLHLKQARPAFQPILGQE